MSRDNGQGVKGDRALSSEDEDKLGFREVARRIATSLVDRASKDGLVVGIDGAWGSGKSSLLYLIDAELKRLTSDRRPTIIDFRPWLVGNRDALINSLFNEFSRKLDLIALEAGDASRVSIERAKSAAAAFRKFTKGVSRVGSFLEFAGDASGIGPLKWFGKGARAAGEAAAGEKIPPALVDLKKELERSLRSLDHRFIVTIDDVDRLEPTEILEVLRLVRSVVDLPNVIYLLCYDVDILAHSIEEAAKVKDGRTYLEKIVQLTVMVPKPEPFQLRQWSTDELRLIAATKDDDELMRLKSVIDFEGGRQLQTPRSVVRALDSIRFFWPPLREAKADLSDLTWLQLIKDGNPRLYRWIEDYCGTAAALSLGTSRVDSGDIARELDALEAAVPSGHFSNDSYRYSFAEQLPGVEPDLSNGARPFKIFQRVSERDLTEAIRKRRLTSPDHYRLYFAFVGPSHALTQGEFDAVWAASHQGADTFGTAFLRLYDEAAVGSLTKADILLERLRNTDAELLSSVQCENVLIAFSKILDDAYRRRPFDMFWVNSVWDRAERLVPLLLSRLAPARRGEVITEMFRNGAAIGWLTSLFRHETFAHGRYGDRQRDEREWLFTDSELDSVSEIMLRRYRSMSGNEVLGSPSPLSLLFAWLQGGDEDGPRKLVTAETVSDECLVETLEKLMSTVDTSSEGRISVLKKDSLAPFMEYHEVRNRVENIRGHKQLDARAKRLIKAFDDAKEW